MAKNALSFVALFVSVSSLALALAGSLEALSDQVVLRLVLIGQVILFVVLLVFGTFRKPGE